MTKTIFPRRVPSLAAILLCAGLLGSAYWPGTSGWCSWLAFVPFFWITQARTPLWAFLWGWIFGSAAWCVGIYWIIQPVKKFLDIPLPMALGIYIFLCAFHGLMGALLAWLCRMLAPKLSRFLKGYYPALAWVAVPAMVSLEGFFPMMFPQGLANTQYFHLPTVQMLEIFGRAGLAWLLMGFNVAAYTTLHSFWERRCALAAGKQHTDIPRIKFGFLAFMAILLLLNEMYGRWRIRQVDAEAASLKASGKILRVGIAQGALAAGLQTRDEFFQKSHLNIQNRLTGLALAQGPLDLMIWPESAYARFLEYERFQGVALNPKIEGKALGSVIRSDIPYRVPLLLNARGSAQGRSYNLSFLIGHSGDFLGLVEKRQIFPFGEYMPYGQLLPFLYRFSPKTADLSPGEKPQVLTTPQGAKLGVLICYEDLYPRLARDQAGLGANVLVNMTNDIWFGTGWVLEQHLHFSALRAIENRRFLLRAVNTGISAVIDPVGRVLRRLEPEAKSYLVDAVALMDFKTYHCSTGDLFYYLGACVLLFEALICLRLKYKLF